MDYENYFVRKSFSYLFACVTFLVCVQLGTSMAEKKYGCTVPKEPLYGTFTFIDRTKTLRLECEEGFYQMGDRDRRCIGGKWNGRPGDCINLNFIDKRCPELRSPSNGRVIMEGRDVGQKAHFMCDPGFVLQGSPVVTCLEGPLWDGILPICSSRQTVEDFANHLKATMIDTLVGATADSETGAQSRLSPGKSGLDIILLMDTSASIGEKSLQSAKDFMKMLVDVFGVSDRADGGENGTRFALMTFSSNYTIVFNLDDKTARNKEAVKSKIDGITNSGGGTDFKQALVGIMDKVHMAKISRNPQRNKEATRAIFLITDAEETSNLDSTRIEKIKEVSSGILIKEFHYEIFTIGVGLNIDRFLLAEIASKPEAEHVFLISEFKDLQRMVNIISEQKIDYGQCGISGKTEITQGSQNAAKGAWPWLGWLTAVSDHAKPKTCGGALLCDRWFMTAASCVSNVVNGSVVPNEPSEVNIFLSDHQLMDQNDNDIVYAVVEDIRIHDNYTGDVIGDLGVRFNDIALIDLGENGTMRPNLGKYLRPLCFPANNTRVQADAEFKAMLAFPNNNRGYTAGWGHAPDNIDHAYTKYPLNELKQNERPLQKTNNCKKRYLDLDTDRFFCVADDHKESDTCVGDIGGPYMKQMTSKRYVAMGLALKTRGCDELYGFSIFLNLIHPDVSTWAETILDGCNRLEEIIED